MIRKLNRRVIISLSCLILASSFVHARSTKNTLSSQTSEIHQIELTGNCSIPDKKLQPLLKPFLDRPLNKSQLKQITETIKRYYHQQGYFAAKAYLSPAGVKHHTLKIIIIEGKLEDNGKQIRAVGKRSKPARVFNTYQKILAPGSALTQANLERAILITNDTPGVNSAVVLYPAKALGAYRLFIDLYDTSPVYGSLAFNNYGYEPTGRYQAEGSVFVDNLLGYGSRLTFDGSQSNTTNNVSFAYGSYSIPLTDMGLKAGVEIDHTHYGANSIQAAAPESSGVSNMKDVFLEYPIIRSRSKNLFITGKLTNYRLTDFDDGMTLDRRTLDYLTLTLVGDWSDSFAGGGFNTYSFSFNRGNLNLNGIEPYRSFDAATARAAGFYSAWEATLSRLQAIKGPLSTYWFIGGQFANKNLDPSIQYNLGGPFGVVGYPVGEALGDEGINFHADLRYDFNSLPWGGNFQVSALYTAGWIRVHNQTWSGWNAGYPFWQNTYTLQSLGLELNQTWSNRGSLDFIVGRRIGGNPGRDTATGYNIDGSSNFYQYWFEAAIFL